MSVIFANEIYEMNKKSSFSYFIDWEKIRLSYLNKSDFLISLLISVISETAKIY